MEECYFFKLYKWYQIAQNTTYLIYQILQSFYLKDLLTTLKTSRTFQQEAVLL